MNIKDIANMAGVSISTVSKVVNQKDQDISQETRQRIQDIIEKYNYTPYSKQIQKSSVSNKTIGLMLPNHEMNQIAWVKSFSETLLRYGYHAVLQWYQGDIKSYHQSLKQLEACKTDAIVAFLEKDVLVDLDKENNFISLSLINENADLFLDLSEIDYMATQKLLNQGHTTIAYIGLDISNQYRQVGFKKALEEYNITYQPELIFQEEDASKLIKEVLNQIIGARVSGVVCQEGKSTFLLYQELRKKGIKIPEDVSIICAEYNAFLCSVDSPIAMLDYDYTNLGISLANQVVKQIKEKTRNEYSLPPILFLENKSIAAPPLYRKKRSEAILVIGSMNMDAIVQIEKMPNEGETLMATGAAMIPGGKGANQAVGIGKLGGNVFAIGHLGNDNDGRDIYQNLLSSHVKTDGIVFDELAATGKAYVSVAQNGKSTIVVHPGANAFLDEKQLLASEHLFVKAKFCLIQTEIPESSIACALDLAQKHELKVLFKPSGMRQLRLDFLSEIEFFIPNQTELKLLVKEGETIKEKAQYLLDHSCKNVIVTLGKRGAYLYSKEQSVYFPALQVKAVDTTGASDAFISAFVLYLSEGESVERAVRFANCAAGISVMHDGVQPAMPDRLQVEMFMRNHQF